MSPEIQLALAHMPARVRPAMQALFQVDSAMGDVVARSTEPALGRIKLAWWREQLEALDENPPPPEPRLRAVSRHLLPAGISGGELAGLEAGWATLLDPEIDPALVVGRGERLFDTGGRLLGASDPMLADAGALYALASVRLVEPARARVQRLRNHRFPSALRPLTMLAQVATRDLRSGSDGRRRVLTMLAHRWSGRIR